MRDSPGHPKLATTVPGEFGLRTRRSLIRFRYSPEISCLYTAALFEIGKGPPFTILPANAHTARLLSTSTGNSRTKKVCVLLCIAIGCGKSKPSCRTSESREGISHDARYRNPSQRHTSAAIADDKYIRSNRNVCYPSSRTARLHSYAF